jgi:hypothetical protein
MPVIDIGPFESSEHQQLVRALAAEWQQPQSEAAEPTIAIQRDDFGRPIHVYVVWSQWAMVDRSERSEIIMDAASVALPAEDASTITIAMGLTPDEAAKMGLGTGQPW